jgi:hypothetical protein
MIAGLVFVSTTPFSTKLGALIEKMRGLQGTNNEMERALASDAGS